MTDEKDLHKRWSFALPVGADNKLVSRRKRTPQSGDEEISVSFRQQIGRSLRKGSDDSHARREGALRNRLEVLREVSREGRILGPFTPRPGGEKLHVLQVFGRKDSGN